MPPMLVTQKSVTSITNSRKDDASGSGIRKGHEVLHRLQFHGVLAHQLALAHQVAHRALCLGGTIRGKAYPFQKLKVSLL